jgi:6-pyruvoyltetrahydropterin/6-carboxytetrahydropterin synthase
MDTDTQETTTASPEGSPAPSTMAEDRNPSPLRQNFKSVISTKTYGHDLGISCAFRQWRAKSHCRFVHGYALSFRFTFACNDKDQHGWVVDFGGLKELRDALMAVFDHKLLVAGDDPCRSHFEMLHAAGAADIAIVPATGCEAFAAMAYEMAERWLEVNGLAARVWLVSVEVSEHGANSAIFQG